MGSLAKACREVPLRRVLKGLGSTLGLGSALSLGAVSVSGWHFLNTPYAARFIYGPQAVSVPHTNRLAGYCAAYIGLSSAFERAMVVARGEEDPWNRIISGAAAFGVLEMRRGLRTAAYSAILGGCMVAFLQRDAIMAHHKVIKEKEKLKKTKTVRAWLTHLLGASPGLKFLMGSDQLQK